MPESPLAPVILLGMHRSGTTLLARCLTEMGLFAGWKLQRNHEAVFFRRLNDEIFQEAGARWDEPGPVRELMGNEGTVEKLADRLAKTTASLRVYSYLGPDRFLRARTLHRIREPWGWKDPRNTYLLPVWLRVFPGARVIHVMRHGVDVAASLRARHQDRSRKEAAASSRILRIRRPTPNPAISSRCSSLSGGFTLWREYLAQAREGLAGLTAPEALEMRFEELLAAPEEVLSRVAAFAGLHPTGPALEKARAMVSPDRGDRWRTDEELSAFAETVGAELRVEGYPG